MRITRELYQEIVVLTTESPDAEICGVISSVDDDAVGIYPCDNLSADPRRHYLISGRDQYRIAQKIAHNKHEWGAIYHSHPKGEAYPSATDVLFFKYSSVRCAIIGEDLVMRLFRIGDGHMANLALNDIIEEELIIVE